jgi:hypothetical protein
VLISGSSLNVLKESNENIIDYNEDDTFLIINPLDNFLFVLLLEDTKKTVSKSLKMALILV